MSFNDLSKNVNYLIKQNQTNRLLEVADYYEKTGDRLHRILKNLLDWAISQKDEFEINPRPIDLKNEIEQIINDLEFVGTDKEISISKRNKIN